MKKLSFLLIAIIILITAYYVYATVDTVTLNSPVNQTNSTTGNITFNCTATPSADTNITNVTLYVWNESTPTNNTRTIYNTTSNTSVGANGTAAERIFIVNNIPELLGYNYTWGCYAQDNASNTAWSSTNNSFKVDTTAPTVTQVSPANESTDYDGSVTFTYNVTDTASSILNCSLFISGSQNQNDTSITKDTNQTFTVEDIERSTTLQWFVSCYDEVGRQGNSSTFYLSTLEIISGGGTGYSGTNYNVGTLANLDTTKELRRKDSVTFEFKSEETHKAKVTKVGADYIKIEISSETITETINIGETKHFDIDEDGTNDLSITLNSIVGSRATLTFQEYTEHFVPTACIESWTCSDWTDCQSDGTRTRTCTDANDCETITNRPAQSESCDYAPADVTTRAIEETVKKTSTAYIWWVIAGIVVLAIIIYVAVKKKQS